MAPGFWHRRQDEIVRWRDVVAYALAAAVFAPVVGDATRRFAAWIAALGMSDWAAVGVIASAGIFAALGLLRPRLAHFRPRVLVRYPCALVAVPLGGLLRAALTRFVPGMGDAGAQEDALALAGAAAALVASVVGWLGMMAVLRRKPPAEQATAGVAVPSVQALLELPVERVLDWARAEEPIDGGGADLFQFGARAERILDWLRTDRRGADGRDYPQTVVVHGPYGSGKTSLMRLVQEKAKAGSDLVFVELNCWGFETSLRAQEHVLAACVDALHQRIDCTALHSMPAAYVRALSAKAPGWLVPLLEGWSAAAGPGEQMRRLAPLLRQSGVRMVAILEDTDRNGAGFDAAHLQAMLFNFRRVERLSFVLTCGPKSQVDFPKIAEQTEFLPELPPEAVLALLDRVRDHALERYRPVELPRPIVMSWDRPRSLVEHAREHALRRAQSGTWSSWAEATSRLVTHPRQVKQVIRGFAEAWDRLHGEVDIDELLMVITLRHCASGAFTFLGRRRSDLRLAKQNDHHTTGPEGAAQTVLMAGLQEDWAEVRKAADYDVAAAAMILGELVPGSAIACGVRVARHGCRPQTMEMSGGPDYWGRLTSGELPAGEVRDQDVMRLMLEGARSSEGLAKLATRIVEQEVFASRVRWFRRRRDPFGGRGEEVLSAIYAALRRRRGRAAGLARSSDADTEYLHRTWQIDSTNLVEWLKPEISACLPGHVRLACDLCEVHAHHRKNTDCAPVRAHLNAEVRRCLAEATGEQLAAGFDPLAPKTLYNLIFASGSAPEAKLLSRASDWAFLGQPVLAAMKSPKVAAEFLPLALFAFSSEPAGVGEPITAVTFREQDVADFFGVEAGRFYELVAAFDPETSLLSGREKDHVRRGVAAAKQRVGSAGPTEAGAA